MIKIEFYCGNNKETDMRVTKKFEYLYMNAVKTILEFLDRIFA